MMPEATPTRHNPPAAEATNSGTRGGERNGNNGRVEDSSETQSELAYFFASFHAIIAPVSITMILSALAVVFINTEETRAAGEEAFSQSYEIFELDEGNSSQNFLASIGNTLIIVSIICVMTFGVVLLYKCGYTKILSGYMVLVTAMLLSYFTSDMWIIAIKKYGWKVDKFSFAYIIYNYTVVGLLAIYYSRGIPRWVNQGYLITSSVVLAWQLSYFNEWTAWTLLVVLALYDLFAVLTPCGPLNALAQLMSRQNAPALPGLLYEASLPTGVQRPGQAARGTTEDSDPTSNGNNNNNSTRGGSRNEENSPNPGNDNSPNQKRRSKSRGRVGETNEGSQDVTDDTSSNNHSLSRLAAREPLVSSPAPSHGQGTPTQPKETTRSSARDDDLNDRQVARESVEDRSELPRGTIPLALAKMYKLRVVDESGQLRNGRFAGRSERRVYSPEEIRSSEWTPKQLRTEVTVLFPQRGGRIEKSENQTFSEGSEYTVYSRSGEVLRNFVVNRQGSVLQVVKKKKRKSTSPNSIKLGLGDFVFYSVLVSKAALYSFTAAVACMLVILTGLAGTLGLLAIQGKALPALPISIFLGVAVFFLTQYLVEPWIHEVLRLPFYV